MVLSEIKQSIAELRKLLHSKDVCLVFNYISRHFEFRKLTVLLNIPLPTFSETKIDTNLQIGSLSVPSMTTQERVHIKSLGFFIRELLYGPRTVEVGDTGHPVWPV